MKALLIVIVVLAISYFEARSQQLFEDGSGESSLYVSSANYTWARFNSSSDNVSIGFDRLRRSGDDLGNISFFGGGELKVKVKDGNGTIFSKKEVNPGLQVNLLFGLKSFAVSENNSWGALFIKPAISYNKYDIVKIVDPSNAVVKETKAIFPQVILHLNFQFNRAFRKDDDKRGVKKDDDKLYHFLGISAGYKKTNNLSGLEEVQISTFVGSNPTQRITTDKVGYAGEYKEFGHLPLNIDYGILPRILGTHTMGFNWFLRTGYAKDASITNSGVGIFFSKPNEPANILGGVAMQASDIFNGYRKETDAWERTSLFFYVGFNIGAK